jgi:hypothetical protein
MMIALKKIVLSDLFQFIKSEEGRVNTKAKRKGIKSTSPVFIIAPATGQCIFFHNNPIATIERIILDEKPTYLRNVI